VKSHHKDLGKESDQGPGRRTLEDLSALVAPEEVTASCLVLFALWGNNFWKDDRGGPGWSLVSTVTAQAAPAGIDIWPSFAGEEISWHCGEQVTGTSGNTCVLRPISVCVCVWFPSFSAA
jgi:hypothetical protein